MICPIDQYYCIEMINSNNKAFQTAGKKVHKFGETLNVIISNFKLQSPLLILDNLQALMAKYSNNP